MQSILTDLRRQWDSGDRVVQLIITNIAVFLFFSIVYLLVFIIKANDFTLYNEIIYHFNASNDLSFMLWHPWTVITYQFMHAGFFHLAGNMIALYWFGGIVQDLLGRRVIIPLYLLGGVCGYFFFLLGSLFFPALSGMTLSLVGASGAVVAIILAAATTAPDYELRLILIGDVKIKYIAAVSILVYLLSIPYGNAGGQLAHLGGALAGWQFVVQLRNGNDFSRFFNHYWDMVAAFLTRKSKPTMTAMRGGKQPKSIFEQPHNISENESSAQKITDAILEKIKRSGYQSLTDKEREWLHKASKH